MKHIVKGSAPGSLVYHKKQLLATYDNYREKDDVRISLLNEQGFICCYCMSRIEKENMKIEHWLPQSKHEDSTLDYKIMFGVCQGFQKSPFHRQCCDSHRKNDKLTINPTNRAMVDTIKYSGGGEISSENAVLDKDLNETLNLNTELLKENRKATLQAVIKFIGNRDAWSEAGIKRAIKFYSSKDERGAYVPYCQVALYFLQKRLSRQLAK
ncbi:retron system putative HNH endonuclease [Bacillus cereus]|uniref:TIGR02646 family protein n=1 Tax=Bacillus cereus MC67 TaxID=1053219 RepID=J8EW37_BACCE|nr:retron system putative HNH endonuclease [Bacillus cereus]EJQ92884.1 TIGR02646 family protein [Bacillus cereus MC67]EOP13449.1 TIGR02646 family protein [Bacillus cereus MC118]